MEYEKKVIHNNENNTVEDGIWNKIKNGNDIIIITGFSSVEFLISKINTINFQKTKSLKFLLGNEFSEEEIVKKVEERMLQYWQERSFSYKNIQKVKKLYNLILNEKIKVKLDKKQHSKIYLNENYATVGSSNFSYSGFKYQKETNVVEDKESEKYIEIKKLADQYWEEGVDYSEAFLELLEKIIYLEDSDWRTAFSFIYEEFFLGKWYKIEEKEMQELWETQKQYLSRSLVLLEMYDGLIVADPTGSGKTFEVANTIKHLHDKYNKVGILKRESILIVCPAVVVDEWEKTLSSIGLISYKVISNASPDLEDYVKVADILVLDEAHAYSNKDSERSKKVLYNNADYKIFMTATPINKKIKDYYGLLVQFGVDNLDQDTFRKLNDFFKSDDINLHAEDIIEDIKKGISNALSKFTIRRTKNKLNEIAKIKNEPLYPQKYSEYYNLNLCEEDKKIINNIKKLANNLHGYFYSKKEKGVSLKRMKAARGLAIHNLMYALRSSKVAAFEHIEGTLKTIENFDICNDKALTVKEGTINTLNNRLNNYNSIIKKAVREDIETYKLISKELEKLSDDMEDTKIELIKEKIRENRESKILLFDKNPITIIYFYEKFSNTSINAYFTTGNTEKNREEIKEIFSPNSINEEGGIAFCTDVFSEGVNLQKASTIIFSDLPYTPKLVEQRIGRIDRMNSNHKEVNVVWVKYPDCLLLPNDVEFKKRYNTISEILGSNYELPDFFNEYSKKKIKDVAQLSSEIIEETNKEIIKDKEKEELTSDSEMFGFNDAFGDYEKLIKFTNPEFYLNKNKYLHKIMKENGSIYSFVEGDSNWGLLYLFDKKNGYPILLFVDIDEEKVYDNLIDLTPKIVSKFKNINKTIKKEMDEEFLNNKIKYCLEQARKPEIKAPSGEQKKSLWLLESFLKEYAPVDLKYKVLYDKLNKILNKKELAKKWHSIIKDVYIEYLKNEIDNRSLPSIINIKDSLKYQGYFEYNLIENLLEDSIEDKIDYSIRVCLMSFKNNN